MNVHDIAARTLIAEHHFSRWGTTKKHGKKSKEINDAEGLVDVATCNVKVCAHPALKLIGTHQTAIRSALDALCGPTVTKGLKFLRESRRDEYIQIFNDGRPENDRLESWFLGDYDTEYALAPSRLNGFYLPRAWPRRDQIANKFRYESRFLDCPISGPWKDWLEESALIASAQLRDQLEEGFRRMQLSCAKLDGRLYDTVFSSMRELLSAVPDLDFAGLPELERIAAMGKALADHDPDVVKTDKRLRQSIADQAGQIADMFGSLTI